MDSRIRALEARRATDAAAVAAARAASDARVATAGLREFAGGVDAAEATLKATTVGLVTREDFLARRDAAEAAAAADAASAGAKRPAPADDDGGRAAKRSAATAKLSFAVDEEEEEDGGAAPLAPLALRGSLKDPTARTDFLPDADRDAREAELRAALRAEYEANQEVKGERERREGRVLLPAHTPNTLTTHHPTLPLTHSASKPPP